MVKKALVLYSGGLDSRLAVKIMQDQGFIVTALHFNLPFGCGCCNQGCNFSFTQKEMVKLKIMEVTKEPLLSEYLKIIMKPKHGRGSSINPCKDCKIFIFSKAKEYFDMEKFDVIASGEVLGQRPMSQTNVARKIIDKSLGFDILRPLSAKLLPETTYEKSGIVERGSLYGISGRKRKEQEKLAKNWNISFPNPGGGCFLCEKPARRIIKLLERKLINEYTLKLVMIGRHFIIDNCWFVVARNESESGIVDSFGNSIVGNSGKPSVYYGHKDDREKAIKLQEAYTKGVNSDERNKFDQYKI